MHTPWSNGNVYFDSTPDPNIHARYLRVNTGNIRDEIIGRWVTYFFVYEPGRQELYIDGELRASRTDSLQAVAQDTTTFTIGAGQEGDRAIVGMMDDVCLYDVALTAEQITDLTGGPVVLEDFEGDLSAWTISEAEAPFVSVTEDMLDPTNQVLQLVPIEGTGTMTLPWVVDPNDSGTSLGFRTMFLSLGGPINDTVVGTADETAADINAIGWGDYYSIVRMGPDTQIDYRDGDSYATAAATSEAMTWYNFIMDLDSASGTYDLYIDDVLVAQDAGFRSQDPNGISHVMIRWSNKQNTLTYIDDIVANVAVPEVAEE
jgi:hypothetical protein